MRSFSSFMVFIRRPLHFLVRASSFYSYFSEILINVIDLAFSLIVTNVLTAILMTVFPANALEAAARRAFSVLGSTELVASSITRQAASCKMALARQNNWRSPALILLPPSRTSASGNIVMIIWIQYLQIVRQTKYYHSMYKYLLFTLLSLLWFHMYVHEIGELDS